MKKSKRIKINKAKIYSIFSIIMVSLMLISTFGSNVYAELNPNNTGVEGLAKALNDVLGLLGNLASAALAGFATLTNAVAVMVYMLLSVMFTGTTGSVFPSPDNIVFNRVAIFDVNFFNPNKFSIYGKITNVSNGTESGNIILKLYNSFQAIAVSVFILAAVIVGIKLALSTIASEKAACKKAMTNWLIGIVVLFLMRLIIAAIFELNEIIVWKISSISDHVKFTYSVFDIVPFIGNALGNIINGIAGIITGDSATKVGDNQVYGYGGMMIKFITKANGGDFSSSIVTFVIIGQMITLIVIYGKRLVYTMILGCMAPLVVVFDTIGKILKGSSNVLSNWFREFVTLVFSQSLHAIVVTISLVILGEFSQGANEGLLGIVAIILISSLIKFDKLIKQIFGLSDGMLGSMRGAGQHVRQAMMGARAGISAISDNKKKLTAAKERVDKAQKTRAGLTGQLGQAHFESASSNILNAAQASSSVEEKRKYIEKFDEHMSEAEKNGYEIPEDNKKSLMSMRNAILNGIEGNRTTLGNNNVNSSDFAREFTRGGSIESARLDGEARARTNGGNLGGSGVIIGQTSGGVAQGNINGANINASQANVRSSNSTHNTGGTTQNGGAKVESDTLHKDLTQLIKEIRNQNRSDKNIKSLGSQMDEADKEIENAKKDLRSAKLAKFMTVPNMAAGVGIGLGMGENFADTVGKGGFATAAFDATSEKIGATKHVGRSAEKVIDKLDNVQNTILSNLGKSSRAAAKSMDRTANVNNL